MPTTCASKMLKSFTPPYTATVIERLETQGMLRNTIHLLLRQSLCAHVSTTGAVVLGKTNMDEFGMGSFNVHSAFGTSINPHSREEVRKMICIAASHVPSFPSLAACMWRELGRKRGGCGSASLPRGHWLRHGRIGAAAGIVLRCCWMEAFIWPAIKARFSRLCEVSPTNS